MANKKYNEFQNSTLDKNKVFLLANATTGELGKILVGDFKLQSKTYSELSTLINISGLVPGQPYLINDFQTVHKILSTSVNNTGSVEPLIVFATAVNSIGAQAYSTTNPLDVITYNITDTTPLAPTSGSKGVITYRESTMQGLKAYFDWRVIVWRRWETVSGNGHFLSYVDTGGGAGHLDSPTFGAFPISTNCSVGYGSYNIIIGDACNDIQIAANVGIAASGVTIGSACYAITIEGECCTVATTGTGYVGGIYIGNNSNVIHIGRRSYNIAIGASCYALHFGTQQSDIWVADSTTRRRIEKGFCNFEGSVSITGATTIDLFGVSNIVVIASVLFGYPNYCGIINLTSGNSTESISVISAILTSLTFSDIRFVPATGLTVTFVDKANSVVVRKNMDFGGVNLPISGTAHQYIQVHKNLVNGLGAQTSDFYLSYSNKVVVTP